jgi:hypothetical protein
VRAPREGYSYPTTAANEVKPAILSHPEFGALRDRVLARFQSWREAHRPTLMGLAKSGEQGRADPKALIQELSESLLACYTAQRCNTSPAALRAEKPQPSAPR